MTIKPLYRYEGVNRTTIVSPIKPEGKYTKLYRIIADEGKAVTKDGINLYTVVDVDNAEGWYEVIAPIMPEGEEASNESN